MLFYPQLLSGAIAQFPLRRTYSVSNVTNLQEDGSRFRATGVDPAWVSWELRYDSLTGSEMDALRSFFEVAQGRQKTFTFLDPAGNLLAWSEDLSQAVWEKSPLVSAAALDSERGKAFRLSSGGAGAARISQLLACPASALLCFDLWARVEETGGVRLAISDSSGRVERGIALDRKWRRCFVAQQGAGDSLGKTVELTFAEGFQVEVAQLSVSPQRGAGNYVRSGGVSGILTATRFDQDSLTISATDENSFACVVQLRSRLG
jgi:hypothetical protein